MILFICPSGAPVFSLFRFFTRLFRPSVPARWSDGPRATGFFVKREALSLLQDAWASHGFDEWSEDDTAHKIEEDARWAAEQIKRLIVAGHGLAIANGHAFCLSDDDGMANGETSVALALLDDAASGPLHEETPVTQILASLLPAGATASENGVAHIWGIPDFSGRPLALAQEMVRRGFIYSETMQRMHCPAFLPMIQALDDADALSVVFSNSPATPKAALSEPAIPRGSRQKRL